MIFINRIYSHGCDIGVEVTLRVGKPSSGNKEHGNKAESSTSKQAALLKWGCTSLRISSVNQFWDFYLFPSTRTKWLGVRWQIISPVLQSKSKVPTGRVTTDPKLGWEPFQSDYADQFAHVTLWENHFCLSLSTKLPSGGWERGNIFNKQKPEPHKTNYTNYSRYVV